MKVIIIGCGRLGSGLAHNLEEKGDSVTVIDINPESFKILGENFKGKTIVGVGFDKDVLNKANVNMVDAVVACTMSDETNALIGRICQNTFRVPRVIARLYDPRKAEIYKSFGIQTISTTTWGIERATEILSYDRLDTVLTLGNADVQMVRIETSGLMVGKKVSALTIAGEIHVVAINRNNNSFLPTLGTVLEPNDIIYIMLYSKSSGRLKSLLGLS